MSDNIILHNEHVVHCIMAKHVQDMSLSHSSVNIGLRKSKNQTVTSDDYAVTLEIYEVGEF